MNRQALTEGHAQVVTLLLLFQEVALIGVRPV